MRLCSDWQPAAQISYLACMQIGIRLVLSGKNTIETLTLAIRFEPRFGWPRNLHVKQDVTEVL